MSSSRVGQFEVIEGKMDSRLYCEIFKAKMLTDLKSLGKRAKCQHDNDPKQILWKFTCDICNEFIRPVTCESSCRSCLTFAVFFSLLAVLRLLGRARFKFRLVSSSRYFFLFIRPVTCASSCRSCLTFAMFSSLLTVLRLPGRPWFKFRLVHSSRYIFPNFCFIWNFFFREVFWKFLRNDLITFGSHPRGYKKNTLFLCKLHYKNGKKKLNKIFSLIFYFWFM